MCPTGLQLERRRYCLTNVFFLKNHPIGGQLGMKRRSENTNNSSHNPDMKSGGAPDPDQTAIKRRSDDSDGKDDTSSDNGPPTKTRKLSVRNSLENRYLGLAPSYPVRDIPSLTHSPRSKCLYLFSVALTLLVPWTHRICHQRRSHQDRWAPKAQVRTNGVTGSRAPRVTYSCDH